MEIFDKAREIAKIVYDDDDIDVVHRVPPRSMTGDWRLHKQGMKVFALAVENVVCAYQDDHDNKQPPLNSLKAADVIAEIDRLQRAQGEGWERVEDKEARKPGQEPVVWLYKDFKEPERIYSTLAFLDRLDVKYERFDDNDISTAIHLRMPESDYDLIFNPKRDVEKRQSRAG